jgi:hypothetical protein
VWVRPCTRAVQKTILMLPASSRGSVNLRPRLETGSPGSHASACAKWLTTMPCAAGGTPHPDIRPGDGGLTTVRILGFSTEAHSAIHPQVMPACLFTREPAVVGKHLCPIRFRSQRSTQWPPANGPQTGRSSPDLQPG